MESSWAHELFRVGVLLFGMGLAVGFHVVQAIRYNSLRRELRDKWLASYGTQRFTASPPQFPLTILQTRLLAEAPSFFREVADHFHERMIACWIDADTVTNNWSSYISPWIDVCNKWELDLQRLEELHAKVNGKHTK